MVNGDVREVGGKLVRIYGHAQQLEDGTGNGIFLLDMEGAFCVLDARTIRKLEISRRKAHASGDAVWQGADGKKKNALFEFDLVDGLDIVKFNVRVGGVTVLDTGEAQFIRENDTPAERNEYVTIFSPVEAEIV